MTMSDLEERLYGGNVADLVVRVGETVRKPATSATSSVVAFLEHLFEVGFRGAPRTLGRDEKGRHVLNMCRERLRSLSHTRARSWGGWGG
jgi:hypothetical protein